MSAERQSTAGDVELITDPDLRAQREAQNGLTQFDRVKEIVEYYLHPDRPFQMRPSQLLSLNRAALEGINSYAGTWRPAGVEIGGSEHKPPGAHLVPEFVESLCDYVNTNWDSKSAIHLSSYVMWRLNWIHPFSDGNGRTSRAAAYMVLCLRLGYVLPGRKPIPDQIAENKSPYYQALEAADSAFEGDSIDLSVMEELLSTLLARQLIAVHGDATAPNPHESQ